MSTELWRGSWSRKCSTFDALLNGSASWLLPQKRRRRPWDDPGDLSPSDEESDDEKDTHTKEEPVRAQSPKYDESYLLNLRFHQLDTLPGTGSLRVGVLEKGGLDGS
jgi:hypothetical protein